MSLLNLWGLFGLLGIAALIIIYLIRPTYQQRFISSTYVWKLSLKYRKKRIPINYLRNILIIICQVLILTACTLIIAEPVIRARTTENYTEKVAVIDASANMRARNGHDAASTSRFGRAVERVSALADEVFAKGDGAVTVILADSTPEVVARRFTADRKEELVLLLSSLECSYEQANIEGAMALAESVITECVDEHNVLPEVLLYTATEYLAPGEVTVVDVSDEGEWNAAILSGNSELNANMSYTFTLKVAVYGRDTSMRVGFDVYGINGTAEGSAVTLYRTVTCLNDEPVTVVLNTSEEDDGGDDYSSEEGPSTSVVYSYSRIYAYIDRVDGTVESGALNDAIDEDNHYYFYGGNKHELRIQYYSTLYNPFVGSIISSWRNALADDWSFDTVQRGTDGGYETEGFDIYIFEHEMPEVLPKDGLVILMDPSDSASPAGSNLNFGRRKGASVESPFYFEAGKDQHPILTNINPEDIWVTIYTPVTADGSYRELMRCDNEPVVLLKDEPNDNQKVLVLSVDVNYSNLSMLPGFSLMMADLFTYFFPGTISGYLYEVGDTARFNAVTSPAEFVTPAGEKLPFTEFPNTLLLDRPGTYTFTQSLYSNVQLETRLFVKLDEGESNVRRREDFLANPYIERRPNAFDDTDILLWVAAALVALLFAEWWLQSRNQF